jgi:hypothetical protein
MPLILKSLIAKPDERISADGEVLSGRLHYNVSQTSGRQYLRETYPKFIPEARRRKTAIVDRHTRRHHAT